MYCEKCGVENKEDANYCTGCGAQIANDGLTRDEAQELKRLQLQNERAKSVFFTILAFVLLFVAFSLMSGVQIAFFGVVVIGIIGFVVWLVKRRRQDQARNPRK